MKNARQIIAIFLFSALLALACGTSTIEPPRPTSTSEPTPAATPQDTPDEDALEEVSALQEAGTEDSSAPTATPTARPTGTPQPTETATIRPSDTPPPAATPTPTPIPCQNDSTFLDHLSIPDGTAVEPGRNFVKIWRVRNSGTCRWTAGYSLGFISGDRMGAAESIPLTQGVEPGDSVSVSIPLTAPSATGVHAGQWQMQAAEGAPFGDVLTAQITVSDLLSTLRDELFFSPGGGIPTSCTLIFENEYPPTRPTFLLGSVFADFANFCLFGLPLDEIIELALYDPGLQFLGSLTFRAVENPDDSPPYNLISGDGDTVGSAWVIDGVTVMETFITMSGGTPFGQWHAVADSATAHREGAVTVETQNRNWYVVGPQEGYDPFGAVPPVRAGDIVVVTGTGFDPGQIIPMGVYYVTGETGTVVYSQLITIAANGRFSLRLVIEDSDPPGIYQVVLGTDEIGVGDNPSTTFNPGHIFRVD